jgi:hypothetical protein
MRRSTSSLRENPLMQKICERCGYVGTEEKRRPGKTSVQVALFVVGLLTGVFLIIWAIYWLWRVMKSSLVCPSCGSAGTMLATSSPRGRQLERQFEPPDVPAARDPATHAAATRDASDT